MIWHRFRLQKVPCSPRSCSSASPPLLHRVLAKPEAPIATPLASFFREPDRVQIFLADVSLGHLTKKAAKEKPIVVGPFALKGKGIELSAQDRQALAQNWVAPEQVVPEEPTRCAFNPDIALRFWRGTSWVDAVLCFSCSDDVFLDEKGKSMNGGAFKNFPALSKIAKKAFPQEQFVH